MRLLAKGSLSSETLALEVFDFLARTVVRLILAGCARESVRRVLVVGGVASSVLLREMVMGRLRKAGRIKGGVAGRLVGGAAGESAGESAGGSAGFPLEVVFGKPEYSGDNAAGIAVLGMREYVGIGCITQS